MCCYFSYFSSCFDSFSSVTILLRYEIMLAWTLSSCEVLLSSPRTRWPLYQLWNVKSPESSYTFGNPYSTNEKGTGRFLSREIVLRFFLLPLQSPGPAPPQTTLRAQRRKCVVKYLTWSIPSPPPAANPFLCWISPTRLSLFRLPLLSSHPRWLDS